MIQSVSLQLGDFGPIILLIVFVIIIVALGVYFVVWALLKKPDTGVESLKGKLGVALTDLIGKNIGEVSIDGVIWKARISERGAALPISKGDSVIVVGVSALTLLVQRQEEK
ncbi:MAG: NfeD family protein [Nitrososphaerales archaeon]